MKNLILSFGLLFISLSTFAQNECQCFKKTYTIIGELTYEEGSNKYYAGIKDGIVYFTYVQYRGPEVSRIITEFISAENVNLAMNNPFSSKSGTLEKTGYTELTLGSSLMDDRNVATSQTSACYMPSESSGYSESTGTTVIGRFSDKAKLLEITDKIKKLQGS
jgi:hypothetical protein